MNAVAIGGCVAAATFAGGLVGLALRQMLPERATAGMLRDMTGAIGGLLTLLTALVLGLLIWTSYGVYSSQTATVRALATQVLRYDLALSDYGPEAANGRTELKANVEQAIAQIWSAQGASLLTSSYGATIASLHEREKYLASLHPSTETQKQALAAATQAANAIAQTRLQMAVALTDPISRPLVVVVVAWAVFIFLGFGLMHAGDAAALLAMAVGAVAVASAVYLVFDLSQPYSGVFQVPSAPLVEVLQEIGKPLQ